MRVSFIAPNPPKLSEMLVELKELDVSGIYTNYGPINKRFEDAAVRNLFHGKGHVVTVNNATIGLMLAIKEAVERFGTARRRYALMPSFTFAATPHAALWCNLTPLLVDIDEHTWLPSRESERRLISRYRDEIAVIVPYATFGNSLDLQYYERLSEETGIPIIVDAAASLGSNDDNELPFGSGSPLTLVYSMHATKTFSTSEAGLIYSSDESIARRVRAMGNFGFTEPRTATMPGINSKLPEVNALLALKKLDGFRSALTHRLMLYQTYIANLESLQTQKLASKQTAHQFFPALIPSSLSSRRQEILHRLAAEGIGSGSYFSPHIAQQKYFTAMCKSADLSTTQNISDRIISLPLHDNMNEDDVYFVCAALRGAMNHLNQ